LRRLERPDRRRSDGRTFANHVPGGLSCRRAGDSLFWHAGGHVEDTDGNRDGVTDIDGTSIDGGSEPDSAVYPDDFSCALCDADPIPHLVSDCNT
jgi:hypothetical protein